MKKIILNIAIGSIVMLTASLFALNTVFASSISDTPPAGPGGPGGRDGGGAIGKYMSKAWADVLGLKEEDYTKKMDEARNKAIELAVADGAITQEQAQQIRTRDAERPAEGEKPAGPGKEETAVHDEMVSALASVFGISQNDLETAMKAGKSVEDIAADKGMTIAGYREKMSEAMTKAVNQAVSKGSISKEQGESMLKRIQERGMGFPGFGHGNPPPPAQDAPANPK